MAKEKLLKSSAKHKAVKGNIVLYLQLCPGKDANNGIDNVPFKFRVGNKEEARNTNNEGKIVLELAPGMTGELEIL